MRKLLLVLIALVFVGVVHAETPFAISADRAVSVSAHMPDFIGLGLDRFIERPQDDQGGDDLSGDMDGTWDSETLDTLWNPEYYVYIDNAPDQEGGPPFTWYDITDGTQISFGGPDDHVAALTLPGGFVFYDNTEFGGGGTYNTVYVSTNFLLGFESEFYDDYSYADYANRHIPREGSIYNPHAFIACFWDDGVKLENSRCYYDTVGNLFIVSWNDWGIRGYEDLVDGTVSLQVVLDMTTYEIAVYYQDVHVPGTGHDYGGSATVGAEDKRGFLGVLYNHMDDGNLNEADTLAIFEWARPDYFDFPDPGGSDPDADGAYEVEQGQPYGPFSWSASSLNNPYGPSSPSYSVELWEDLREADRIVLPEFVGGWEEDIKYRELTTSTSHTIDTSDLEPVPYNRDDSSQREVWCDHYQLVIFASDGWGYTEATNVDAPGGTDHHYWLDVTEPPALPDIGLRETSWGAIKAEF
jgi:hypothetical protein